MIQSSFVSKILPRDGKRHEPLRTAAELAAEFGVELGHLAAFLRLPGAPKAVVTHRHAAAGRKAYFKPSEVRRWWKEVTK